MFTVDVKQQCNNNNNVSCFTQTWSIFIQYLQFASSNIGSFILEKLKDSQRLYAENEQTLRHIQHIHRQKEEEKKHRRGKKKKKKKTGRDSNLCGMVFHIKTLTVVYLCNHWDTIAFSLKCLLIISISLIRKLYTPVLSNRHIPK